MEQQWSQKVAYFPVILLYRKSQCLEKSRVEACLNVYETKSGYYLETCEKAHPEQVLFSTRLENNEYTWNLDGTKIVGFLSDTVSQRQTQGPKEANDLEEPASEESGNDAVFQEEGRRNALEHVVLNFEKEEEARRFWDLLTRTCGVEQGQLVPCENECPSLTESSQYNSVASQEDDLVLERAQQSEHMDKEAFPLPNRPSRSEDKSTEDASILFTEPELSNLDSFERSLEKASSEEKEQFLSRFKEDSSILEKFIDLFHMCEDLKMVSELKKLSNIIYSILVSGNSSILELLLSDYYYYSIISMLEYRDCNNFSSEKTGEYRAVNNPLKLRKYLKKLMNIEDLVTFSDKQVAERVRLNQRLMFLKQTFFPFLSEDHMLSVLNSVMFFNNLDIINYFRSSPDSLDGLFETLKSYRMDERKQNEGQITDPCTIFRFIYELCDLCKSQQQHSQQSKERLFGIFRLDDLLPVCTKFLTLSKKFQERFFCANIILVLLNSFSSPVREYILKHVEQFKAIVTALKEEDDFALSSTLTDIICMLIDPDTTKDFLQKDEFLDLFYEDIVNELLASFDRLEKKDSSCSACYSKAPFGDHLILAACQSCNILSHCVANHGYRPKYVIWRLNALNKACRLFAYRDTCISLYPLRLLRYCIGQRDEFYNRYIVKEDILGLVFRAAETCASRKNIFYCSLLEMLSFIDKSGVTLLIQHIGKQHLTSLSFIFGDSPVVRRYRGMVEEDDTTRTEAASVPFLGKRRTAESDSEERYFEENDEDSVPGGPPMEWSGVVDRDLILPQGTKDTEEEPSVFLQLEKEELVPSPRQGHKRRGPVVALGKLGSSRPLVDYSWSEEEEATSTTPSTVHAD